MRRIQGDLIAWWGEFQHQTLDYDRFDGFEGVSNQHRQITSLAISKFVTLARNRRGLCLSHKLTRISLLRWQTDVAKTRGITYHLGVANGDV